jgi:hypothetical protein
MRRWNRWKAFAVNSVSRVTNEALRLDDCRAVETDEHAAVHGEDERENEVDVSD